MRNKLAWLVLGAWILLGSIDLGTAQAGRTRNVRASRDSRGNTRVQVQTEHGTVRVGGGRNRNRRAHHRRHARRNGGGGMFSFNMRNLLR